MKEICGTSTLNYKARAINMIPIKEAIATGAWLHAEHIEPSRPDMELTFSIKLTSFSKIDTSKITNPFKSINPDYYELNIALGLNIWLLGFDIINLCKKRINDFYTIGNALGKR